MIRVFLYLVVAAVLAFATVWLADRPGDVSIVWQGYRIEMSVMVLVAAIGFVVVTAILIWTVFRAILRTPDWIAMYLSQRRGVRGYLAISRGLVAVGAGDARSAKRLASEAGRIAPGDPLGLLLNAQVAQLEGNRADAEAAFRAMAEREDTRLLGLRGLYIEARRREDLEAARLYAEEAAETAPALAWAGHAVLDFRCAAGDWNGALAALDRSAKYAVVDRAQYRRQRAVLLTAQAIATEHSERERTLPLALEAVKLAPTLVPAAALAGRLLGEAGELRKASRIIEKAWEAHPQPELAETYAYLRPGNSARERLARVQRLADRKPHDPESALAVARAALDAQEFATARAAIRPLLSAPTQRVALMMAEIESRESGDEGRAREWTARAVRAARDPAWTADGFVADRWHPVSPVTGRLDAFQWRVPVSQIADERAVLDMADEEEPAESVSPPLAVNEPMVVLEETQAPTVAVEPAPEPEPEPVVAAPVAETAPPPAVELAPASPAVPPPAPEGEVKAPAPVVETKPSVSPRPAAAPARSAAVRPEPVAPVIPVPDDPGPDAPELEPDPPMGPHRQRPVLM